MKLYTRTGDQGTTALFGGGRVAKNHPRIEAYGTVDEVNAWIGVIRSYTTGDPRLARCDDTLERIQRELFVLGSDLATPVDAAARVPRIDAGYIERLEADIDGFEGDLPALRRFILPGGSRAAAFLHVARTVCRRAERLTVGASALKPINEQTVRYLNRLSDLLFALSRWVNHREGVQPPEWIADS